MTNDAKPKPPVLGDSKRPPVPERMQRWLQTADAIRKAREDMDPETIAVERKVERIEHRYLSGK